MSYAEGLVDSVERLTCGAILIDWLGRVIRVNKKAEDYIGVDLDVISSRLQSRHRENNKALQELVTACAKRSFESKIPSHPHCFTARYLQLIVHLLPIVRRASDVF